jgi:hypothetical protein
MIYIYLVLSLIIILLSVRNYGSITIMKKYRNLANDQSTKLVKLTQENYLLKKKCDFLEKQLYPNNENKKEFDLEEILGEINKFGIDKLSKDKLDFLKFGNHNDK